MALQRRMVQRADWKNHRRPCVRGRAAADEEVLYTPPIKASAVEESPVFPELKAAIMSGLETALPQGWKFRTRLLTPCAEDHVGVDSNSPTLWPGSKKQVWIGPRRGGIEDSPFSKVQRGIARRMSQLTSGMKSGSRSVVVESLVTSIADANPGIAAGPQAIKVIAWS